jgi:hypothetical protein
MLHTPKPDQMVGVVVQIGRLSPQYLNLEAQSLVQVHVEHRQDLRVVCVSAFDQSAGQLALLVVVDERERGYRRALAGLDLVINQSMTYEIANRFGPVAELPTLK